MQRETQTTTDTQRVKTCHKSFICLEIFNSVLQRSIFHLQSQQLQGQLQKQHSVDTGNYIMSNNINNNYINAYPSY